MYIHLSIVDDLYAQCVCVCVCVCVCTLELLFPDEGLVSKIFNLVNNHNTCSSNNIAQHRCMVASLHGLLS